MAQTGSNLPAVLDPFVDPVYEILEKRAIISVKRELGPWVVGAAIGLLAWNIYTARALRNINKKFLKSLTG